MVIGSHTQLVTRPPDRQEVQGSNPGLGLKLLWGKNSSVLSGRLDLAKDVLIENPVTLCEQKLEINKPGNEGMTKVGAISEAQKAQTFKNCKTGDSSLSKNMEKNERGPFDAIKKIFIEKSNRKKSHSAKKSKLKIPRKPKGGYPCP